MEGKREEPKRKKRGWGWGWGYLKKIIKGMNERIKEGTRDYLNHDFQFHCFVLPD